MTVIKRYLVALLLILLFGGHPFLMAAIASLIANAGGCRLDEGKVHPCVVWGIDVGGLLYGMNVLGWLAIGTISIAITLFCVWCITALLHGGWTVVRRRLNRQKDP